MEPMSAVYNIGSGRAPPEVPKNISMGLRDLLFQTFKRSALYHDYHDHHMQRCIIMSTVRYTYSMSTPPFVSQNIPCHMLYDHFEML